MVPMALNCAASDWQNSLRDLLGRKTEVDLMNVNVEFDGVYLEEIAKENGMFILKDERARAAFFRKTKF